MSSKTDSEPKILDFNTFREKKALEKSLSGERPPLFVSHLNSKIKGSPHFKRPKADDFGDRIQRIRSSLEKINMLMHELRRQSKENKEKRRNRRERER